MCVKILFKDPTQLVSMSDGLKERRSKQIEEKSLLHTIILKLRLYIKTTWPQFLTYPDRPVHIELTRKVIAPEEMKQRALLLHDKIIDVMDSELWGWCGNAFVLFMDKDRKLYCTVVCFKSATPDPDLLQIRVLQMVKEITGT